MVSPHEPAVESPLQPETEATDLESPEVARAKQLAASLNALEQALEPKPRSTSGKRNAERLANSRRLLEARIASNPDFERHSRKCQVCHSRWVEEIEEAYYNWSSAQWIINAFNISYDDAVYRHARAIGLDIKRRKNVVIAVEKLIEKVDEVAVTSSTVLRAVRALSCLDANGRWTDPPTTHVVVTTKNPPPAQTPVSHTGAPNNESGDDAVCSTARPEPHRENESSLSEEGLMSKMGFSSNRHASPPQEENVLSSTERSEDAPCKGTALAVPQGPASSGVLTPEVSTFENSSALLQPTSSERSEPHRASDPKIPPDAPSSTGAPEQRGECDHLATRHSPLATASNRGTYEKLEIAATD